VEEDTSAVFCRTPIWITIHTWKYLRTKESRHLITVPDCSIVVRKDILKREGRRVYIIQVISFSTFERFTWSEIFFAWKKGRDLSTRFSLVPNTGAITINLNSWHIHRVPYPRPVLENCASGPSLCQMGPHNPKAPWQTWSLAPITTRPISVISSPGYLSSRQPSAAWDFRLTQWPAGHIAQGSWHTPVPYVPVCPSLLVHSEPNYQHGFPIQG
jgi:hypothetical protein